LYSLHTFVFIGFRYRLSTRALYVNIKTYPVGLNKKI